jgi:hypothetical protein
MSIEGEQVAEEREEVVNAQAVGEADISAGQLDVVAAELAVERSLQIDELIVGDLTTLAKRGEGRMLFHNFENAGIHATLVFSTRIWCPPRRPRCASGRDEVRQVDLQKALGQSTVLHLQREVADDLGELRGWRSQGQREGEFGAG